MAIRWGRCIGAATILLAAYVYAARPLHVYMMKGGEGTWGRPITILSDENYQRALRSIFQGHELTFDFASNKAQTIDHLFKSDIVYLSLHANANLIVVPNNERLTVAELATAYTQTYHQKGPSLVIISGCETLHDQDSPAMNFPAAFGIKNGTSNRAYLGYKEKVNGSSSDRFFRVFLAIWMRSPYPTLTEAKTKAAATVERMINIQTP
jgi:hypothetical protein